MTMNNWFPSPNFTPGWKVQPLGIIIHWCAGKYANSITWLCSPEAKASAHWVIGPDGSRCQIVSTKDRAWHAGESSTKYGKACNNYTFGIELAGPPSYIGLPGWPMQQLESAARVCRFLAKKYPSICFITDHSTIAPGRKVDVKKHFELIDKFPWDSFVELTGIEDYKE